MTIETKFDIGQLVILKTDIQKSPRMITNIKINPGNVCLYDVMKAQEASSHYEIEIEPIHEKEKTGFIK